MQLLKRSARQLLSEGPSSADNGTDGDKLQRPHRRPKRDMLKALIRRARQIHKSAAAAAASPASPWAGSRGRRRSTASETTPTVSGITLLPPYYTILCISALGRGRGSPPRQGHRSWWPSVRSVRLTHGSWPVLSPPPSPKPPNAPSSNARAPRAQVRGARLMISNDVPIGDLYRPWGSLLHLGHSQTADADVV